MVMCSENNIIRPATDAEIKAWEDESQAQPDKTMSTEDRVAQLETAIDLLLSGVTK